MWSTPRKPNRGGRRGSRTPATPATPVTFKVKGYFNNGHWFCDCSPRKPAVKQQVKKEGPNKGKRFYTCQNARDKQCGFFLWEDMAQTRERGALFANSRTEPKPRSQPWLGSTENEHKDDDETMPPTPSKKGTPRQTIFGMPPRQRSGSESEESLNTDGKMELEIQEQMKAMAEDAERSSQRPARGSQLSSSHTMPANSIPATPSRKRQRDASPDFLGDSDSETERALIALEKIASAKKPFVVPPSSEPKSLRADAGLPSTPSGSFSAQKTQPGNPSYLPPTPITRGTVGDTGSERASKRARFADPAVGAVYESPSSQSQSQTLGHSGTVAEADEDDITETILELLADQPISAAVRRRVRDTLEVHARKVVGVKRGRDTAREALTTKDKKVVELQEKVADLENSRKMERQRVKELMETFGDD